MDIIKFSQCREHILITPLKLQIFVTRFTQNDTFGPTYVMNWVLL